MRLVFVIDNVFERNAQLFIKVVEKILFIDKGHSRDFFDDSFSRCTPIGKIGCDGNGQFATKFLSFEALKNEIFEIVFLCIKDRNVRNSETQQKYASFILEEFVQL